MSTENKGLGQIHGIRELRCEDQPGHAIGILDDVVEFFEDGILAEGNAILPHVAGTQIGRYCFQASVIWFWATAPRRHWFPLGDGITLPCTLAWRLRFAEMKEPRLRARVDVHAEGVDAALSFRQTSAAR